MTNRDPAEFAMGDDLTLVLPTLNSARHIDIILSFYYDHGIPVTVFVDDRSTDETIEVVKKSGMEAVVISNPTPPIMEGLIAPMSRLCGTKWVLRLDDDELPTLAMMEFIREKLRKPGPAVYGFQRHECAISCKGRLLSHSRVSPYVHRQWRLYQTEAVTFAPKLHTPGFKCDGMGDDGAPPEVPMIHLDWALHSHEERRRKVERYQAHPEGERATENAYSYYLYEDQPWPMDCFRLLAYPEFAKVCREISRRFPELCVKVEKGIKPAARKQQQPSTR